MKNMNGKSKIIYAIACIIIIAGAIVYFTKGFKFNMEYAKKDQIVLSNKTGFEISKVQEISKEVFENKEFTVQEVEIFKNAVEISAEEINEEEKANIIEKINAEYSLEISADDIKIENVEQTKIKDIVKPYILPVIITYALILLYFLIRYRKIGVKKVLLTGIILPMASELEFYSILAICRIPFGNVTTAVAIGIYVFIFTIIAIKFDKEEKLIRENEAQKNISKNKNA